MDIQQITSPDNRANPQEGDPCHTLHAAGNSVVAFSSKDAGQDAGQDATDDLSPTLRSMQVAIAFGWNKSESQTMRISDETTDALQSSPTSNPAIAFESRIARNGRGAPSEIVPPLKAESGQSGKGDAAPLTAGAGGVRRLTPTECLRLQGFPDDWFDGPELSDSAKYRCLGNAVPVPVVQWIGQRIMESLEPL